MRSSRFVAFVALAVLAACSPLQPRGGIGTEPGSTPTGPITSAPTPTEPANELNIIVIPDGSGEYPADLMVGCPSGPDFRLGDLTGAPSGETDELLEAIQPFLASEEGQFWPQEGWRVMIVDGDSATLVNTSEDGLGFMFLTRTADVWAWSGSQMGPADCPLQFQPAPGLNSVEWRLDPAAPAITPETRSIAVLLTERECVSGQEIGDRLLGPQVVMTDSQVRLAFAATPPPGDAFDCQGNPETPYLVDLPEPVGTRTVVEGYGIGINLEDLLD